MSSMTTVIHQVAVMMVLILLGAILTKRGTLTEKGASEISSILLHIVTPCLIVNSLLGVENLSAEVLLFAMGVPALALGVAVALGLCFFRREPPERKKVLRFSAVFSNAGFMGLPLVQGIVGDRGVALGSFFVVVFNLVCWTYGYGMMNGGRPNLKKAILNPGVIGLAVGLPICFLRLKLPGVIAQPIGLLAGLNTPLAMLVIGSFVARADLRAVLRDKGVYLSVFFRLVLAPGVFLLLLLLLRPERDLFLTSVIQAAAPVAANAVLFSVEYGGDSRLASGTVAFSTLLSILTIPVFALLAQLACGALGIG